MQFWKDSYCQLLGFDLAKNIHKSSFHTPNVLFSIVLYMLCAIKVDFFVTCGPSVTTVVPLSGFCVYNPFISATFSEMDYVEEHSVKLLCQSHFCF